jgi:hypothetical protein
MTEIIMYNSLDLVLWLIGILVCTIVFAIVKGWYDNKKWEKHIYKILEQYREKYGVDEGCEMLMYKEENEND